MKILSLPSDEKASGPSGSIAYRNRWKYPVPSQQKHGKFRCLTNLTTVFAVKH